MLYYFVYLMFVQYSEFVSNIITLISFLLLGDSIVTVNFHTIIFKIARQTSFSHLSSRPARQEYTNNQRTLSGMSVLSQPCRKHSMNNVTVISHHRNASNSGCREAQDGVPFFVSYIK